MEAGGHSRCARGGKKGRIGSGRRPSDSCRKDAAANQGGTTTGTESCHRISRDTVQHPG